jgi:hypothetical protein
VYNSTYKKLAVPWLNEVLCFVSSSVVADSFRLRNRQLLVAAKRYRKRKIYLITGRVDIEFDFCSITVSSMEKLATVGRDDLSKS